MSAHEIEAAIIRMTPQQLVGLLSWLETYHSETARPGVDQEEDGEWLEMGSYEPEDLYAAAD